jgi:hypothetical protein
VRDDDRIHAEQLLAAIEAKRERAQRICTHLHRNTPIQVPSPKVPADGDVLFTYDPRDELRRCEADKRIVDEWVDKLKWEWECAYDEGAAGMVDGLRFVINRLREYYGVGVMNADDQEPPVGSKVRDIFDRIWTRDEHSPACWTLHDYLYSDPETWTKVAGNFGPVTLLGDTP